MLIVLSIFMIALAGYRLWSLYQPRVGPVGDGSHAPHVYISIYCGLLAGVCFLIVGIIRLVKRSPR